MVSPLRLLLLLTLIALSMRGWITLDVVPGHNWDYTFPSSSQIYDSINKNSNFLYSDWKGRNLLMQSLMIHSNLLLILTRIFDISTSIKLIIVIIFFVSCLGMNSLLQYLKIKENIAFYFSLLYAFSPYFFSLLIGGSWNAWVSYAFTPFLIKLLINKDTRFKTLVYLIIFQNLSIGYPQFFLLGIITALALYQWENNLFHKDLVYKLFLIFLTNLYWLIPLLTSWQSFNQEVFNNMTIASNGQIMSSSHSFFNQLFLWAFNNRNFYQNLMTSWEKIIYIIGIFILWIFILKNIKSKNDENRSKILLILIFVVLIFSANEKSFFSDVSNLIYEYFPLMRLYRSPQNFYFLLNVSFIILSAIAFNNHQFNFRTKLPIKIIIVAIIFPFIYVGDFGTERLKKLNMSAIDYISVDSETDKIYNFLYSDSENFKFLPIPLTQSPKYLKTHYQGSGQGGIPEYEFSEKSPYIPKNGNVRTLLGEMITDDINLKYLGENNVKYIVIRWDIVDNFEIRPSGYSRQIIKTLESKGLIAVNQGLYYKIFEIPSKYFRPIGSLYQSNNKIIDFKKLNPTLYVHKISKPLEDITYKISGFSDKYWCIVTFENNERHTKAFEFFYWKEIFKSIIYKKNSCINKDGSINLGLQKNENVIILFFYLQYVFLASCFLTLLLTICALAARRPFNV